VWDTWEPLLALWESSPQQLDNAVRKQDQQVDKTLQVPDASLTP